MTVQRQGNGRLSYYGGPANMRCHGCNRTLPEAALYCYLANATDRQSQIWGLACCARQYPLAHNAHDYYPMPEPVSVASVFYPSWDEVLAT